MQRQFKLFLNDMLTASRRMVLLAGECTPEELEANLEIREGILWNFIVLGEATRQIPQAIKDRYASIAWRNAADMRNRIAHGYFSMDWEILHHTVHYQLPALIQGLEELLADPDLPESISD